MFWKKESQHPIPTGNAAIPDKSIAVLPFENLGEEKEHAFLADGVQDDILIKLAKIADLKVISRTSVMQDLLKRIERVECVRTHPNFGRGRSAKGRHSPG